MNIDSLLIFTDWVAGEVCQRDFENNASFFAEIACRKLNQLGIIRKDGENWVYEKKATNADRIRSMSDEELEGLFRNLCCPYSLDMGGWEGLCNIESKGCGRCWSDWLRQEAEHE